MKEIIADELLANNICPCGSENTIGCPVSGCPLYLKELYMKELEESVVQYVCKITGDSLDTFQKMHRIQECLTFITEQLNKNQVDVSPEQAYNFLFKST